jgi:ubiquinone/menaquinone biosynthesis C-methylase UbiE
MSESENRFAAAHYGPRAQDYVTSKDHSSGEDLDQIEAALRVTLPARVLDLGCGGGHVSYRAAPLVEEVVACDVTPAMLDSVVTEATARGLKNITVRQAAAEALPFADDSFDAVLCRFTTHHWSDMEAGLREASRVLKPGARAVFIDVFAPVPRVLDTHLQAVELLRDVSHVRNYAMAEWLAALPRCGFAVERLSTRRMRMDFPVWIARTRTTEDHVRAIRSLQQGASPMVKDYFKIGEDGGFDLDAVTIFVRNN